MSTQKEWTRLMRFSLAVSVTLVAGSLLPSGSARAGERQFLVILATSPKQYPNPDRDPLGRPTGGLISKQLIYNQYFDRVDNDTRSFAEYWEEISYGDVTISGNVTDWINLQWAIQPPLLDPTQDDDIFDDDEDVDDVERRNSPANFYDLNDSGQYEYGQGERFENFFASTIIDRDGDPDRTDNGPTQVEPGSGSQHYTESPFFVPVWKPGERFVDMDEDDRWDGLDEANNNMDWDRDGLPDLRGPWVDLNEDGQADNPSDCIYLQDSDNDGNPDCCPNGPGSPGCGPHNPDAAQSSGYLAACPPALWTDPSGEINDCNGNLVPDLCDLSCISAPCLRTDWLDSDLFIDTGLPCRTNADCETEAGFGCNGTCMLCGSSQDVLPWTGSGDFCVPSPNTIPDECEFVQLEFDTNPPRCVEEILDPEHPCAGADQCERQAAPRADNMLQRCEFDDSNANDELDIVEPFENFLRRYDPCLIAPEASPDNQDSVAAHWVKVYDPNSPIPDVVFSALNASCPLEVSTFNYHDDSYIRHNYPARGKLCSGVFRMACEVCSLTGHPCQSDTDCPSGETCLQCGPDETCRTGVEELIDEAGSRVLFGSHDPDGKLADAGTACICPLMPCNSQSDCTDLSPTSICAAVRTCIAPAQCASGVCFNPDGSNDGTNNRYCGGETFCTCVSMSQPDGTILENACIAGYHREFNPPDKWHDTVAINAPGDEEAYTTKMRAAPNEGGTSSFLPGVVTPKPGAYISPSTGRPIDDPWYAPAWQDRYNAVSCPNPELRLANPAQGAPDFVPCECEHDNFDPLQPEGPNNPRRDFCLEPLWPGESFGGLIENVRPFVPFDDVDPDVYDALVNRRFFKANAGGLNGDGTGWIGCDSDFDAIVLFETGELNDTGFAELCDAPILPEEVDGPGEPGIFYDGWVEHDDLASSKYHRAGDQRLGEITSPFSSTHTYQPPASDPEDPPDEIEVEAIWGEDRGIHVRPSSSQRDDILVAAGPYAMHIHGNHHRDAGNLEMMEVLTWRREPPFNNGLGWEYDLVFVSGEQRIHPYAGPTWGPNLGFRDYNLDGLLDQGEARYPGSENYQSDSNVGSTNDGIRSLYPFHRDRMMEDCIEALDEVVDFDDWVDPVALDRITCTPQGNSTLLAWKPANFVDGNNSVAPSNFVRANGILSGIVLLPLAAHIPGDFNLSPRFIPIHNEDGNDPAAMFPTGSPQINWNLFFHDLIISLGISGEGAGAVPTAGFQSGFSAHEYLHAWEGFPDLYDYDVYEPQPGPVINCPVGGWDIMANGGLVHPAPILKEKPCTEWISPIDLTTVLTPGVTKTLTLPRAEFVRDSYYFLENENSLGERYYFWSAGSGFDEPNAPDGGLPGRGMLIMHTDVGSNPEALPPLNVTGTRYTYQIVQADGRGELDLCTNVGDTGDPWPGSSNATTFNFTSNPPANWYTQNSWTGIEMLGIRPDGHGSVAIDINWSPTSIPSLRFRNPPGGVSIPGPGGVERYPVNFSATDVYGGTTVRLYYIRDEKACSVSGAPCTDDSGCSADEFCRHETPISGNLAGQLRKTTPGTRELSIDWNIAGITDGRYVVFAELIPGQGADGFERSSTVPRAGRNNIGDGTLTFGTCLVGSAPCNQANVCPGGACLIPPDAINIVGHRARSEAWSVTCIDANTQTWSVYGTLTQPEPEGLDPGELPPYPVARTDATYTSGDGEVKFSITHGPEPFVLGDTFTFITTGKTAASGSVTIEDGKVKQDPTARIDADRLSGDPPLLVNFDGRASTDPNGEPLNFRWNFGDGSSETMGAQVPHTFTDAGLFTVVLRVTNPSNLRFGEAAIDIDVTNNSPNALVTASPTSGPPSSVCETQGFCSLTVQFSAAQSSDLEDQATEMIYVWDFGDGVSANDSLIPGTQFSTISHFYSRRQDGTLCTTENPCEFTATVTVRDSGGKSDSDVIGITVGNSTPVANITYNPPSAQGPDPLTVVFNAQNSFDPDDDVLKVEWIWGDGTPNEVYGVDGVSGDGGVPHTYELPAGVTSSSFKTRAIVRDFDENGHPRGGEDTSETVTVIVNEASVDASDPTACFHICAEAPCFETDPAVPLLDEEFVVDAGCSHDNPAGGQIEAYVWDFGDNTSATGMTATHTYTESGTYAIVLTVTDADAPPHTGSTLRAVSVAGDGDEPDETENEPPIAAFEVNPPNGFNDATLFTFDASGSTDPDGPLSGLTYSWNFGDGVTAVGKIVTHVYDSVNPDGSGNYMVRLTVRDEGNASTDAIQLVGVADNAGNLSPFAFIATGPRSGTAPVTLTFDGRNSFDPNDDTLEFTWEFEKDGLSVDTLSGPLITKLFEDPGTYTVELFVDDRRGGVAVAGPETVTITPPAGLPDDGDGDGDGEPPPEQPVPGRLCGPGMLPTLLGSLLGLVAMMANRRRFLT